MALKWVEEHKLDHFSICSDSVAVLKSFKSSHQDILFSILQIHSRVVQNDTSVDIICVPAHVGIKGNEEVDKLAKQALQRETIEIQVLLSKSEIKVLIWNKVSKEWQVKWNNGEKGRLLFSLINKVNQNIKCIGKSRKEEVIFHKILLGNSNLNSKLKILGTHPNGICECCNDEETIPHVFIECRKYEQERGKMIEELRKNRIQELNFKVLIKWASEVNSKAFYDFIRETGLINRI